MPHNFYLHSGLVLSRRVSQNSFSEVSEANSYNRLESAFSLVISFFINMSVIGTFAYYSDESNSDINLYNAHDALADTFGDSAKYIWAVGLLAAGQSSTMTGTYAGQFVMEGFLEIKLPIW
jgi:natural resistance-associated macrophage protein